MKESKSRGESGLFEFDVWVDKTVDSRPGQRGRDVLR